MDFLVLIHYFIEGGRHEREVTGYFAALKAVDEATRPNAHCFENSDHFKLVFYRLPRPGGEPGIFLIFVYFLSQLDHSATAPP